MTHRGSLNFSYEHTSLSHCLLSSQSPLQSSSSGAIYGNPGVTPFYFVSVPELRDSSYIRREPRYRTVCFRRRRRFRAPRRTLFVGVRAPRREFYMARNSLPHCCLLASSSPLPSSTSKPIHGNLVVTLFSFGFGVPASRHELYMVRTMLIHCFFSSP